MEHSIQKYKQYGDCMFISNGTLEIVASLAFGPRVLRFGRKGRPNILYEHPLDAPYLCTEEGWRVYGGLRLAFAPESEKTYWPDNAPVDYELLDDGVVLKQAEDGYLNVRKRIKLQFTERPDTLAVGFEIENIGDAPLFGAPWAITAVRPDGVLRTPFRAESGGAAPKHFLSLWGDTSLADERLSFSEKEMMIRPAPTDQYFKLGFTCAEGVIQYDISGQSYRKRFEYDANARYPDNNVNAEIYCCRHMMEIESLAALRDILPGETAEHREWWSVRP